MKITTRAFVHFLLACAFPRAGGFWTNADSEVLFSRPEKTPEISSEWLAGTYGIGASVSDIAADLDALRCECIPAAILS